MSENDDIEVDSDVGGLVSLSKWLVKKHNIPASLRYLIELARLASLVSRQTLDSQEKYWDSCLKLLLTVHLHFTYNRGFLILRTRGVVNVVYERWRT